MPWYTNRCPFQGQCFSTIPLSCISFRANPYIMYFERNVNTIRLF
ncbi:hypothetical protein HMPREF0372_04144 [Flavonifractor plautii ATCC 29863]|uniref:Uncharacterized protein n=1 Tax=Flavonifractor plautii ATCC 29863 TaxID=411475 RepID=G9YX76_FLAPL|nr:hypothetical protein HMPREF0372_04144 [Flavonifractor plautii ATCC 29863]